MKEISISVIAGLLGGWFAAFRIEKRYVSRSALLLIVVDGWFLMGGEIILQGIQKAWYARNIQPMLEALQAWPIHWFLKYYLALGMGIMLLALWCYSRRIKNSKTFYEFTYKFFSSKTMMPISTTFVLFSRYCPDALYTEAFWIVVGGFCCLSWFPKITLNTVGVILAIAYFC